MTAAMWVLVVVFSPENFNVQYRTPDVMERVMNLFAQKADCEAAITALKKGKEPLGGLKVQRYFCTRGGRYQLLDEVDGNVRGPWLGDLIGNP